ncbi:MAG TPA: diguanylate cyclase [Acidimicrobiales bacterium]|nr:diguanylate cyclase [Acidimicrobiales bacterium]
MIDHFCVLVAESDPSAHKLFRSGLEHAGAQVISAESLAQARALLDEPFEAVVLGRDLLDGAGESLLGELLDRLPPSRIFLHSWRGGPPGVRCLGDRDVDAVVRLLDLDAASAPRTMAQRAHRALGRVHREWVELCRWDPAVPPDARPPIAESVIKAVSNALERPQPLGWGLDPALEPVAAAFGLNVGDVHVALAELVCLREAFVRVVVKRRGDSRSGDSLPADSRPGEEVVEALERLQMIVERTMLVVAETGMRRLAQEALLDPLTGLGNRRAFDQDLARELARSARSGGRLTVALLDVVGLKTVNDSLGHPAGDQLLRRVAGCIRAAVRAGDRAYRIGGDEFALLLADASGVAAEDIAKRLEAEGSPPVTVGTASLPGDDPDRLVQLADARLYARRRRAGPPVG